MSFQCTNCNKPIPVLSEWWVREPDKFDKNGIGIARGKSLPFCRLGCIFSYCGHQRKKEKEQAAKSR